MRLDIRRGLSVIALIAVAATSCSHNTLRGSSQDLNVTYTPNPVGTGRYESASVLINKLQLLPADPATAALYGTQSLLVRFEPFNAKLTETQDVAFSHIALSAGSYRVSLIEFAPLVLIDEDVSTTPASCIEGIAVIDGTRPVGQVPQTIAFTDPPSLAFTIAPGQTKLALTVNVPGLIAGYEAAYTCQLGCGFGGGPCLTAYNDATFRAALLANVTLE